MNQKSVPESVPDAPTITLNANDMNFQFNGFRATKPVVRLIDAINSIYEVFFVVYDSNNKKHHKRFKAGINSLPVSKRLAEAKSTADVLWEALQNKWDPLKLKYPPFEKAVEQKALLLCDGLDMAEQHKKKFLSKFSMYDYSGCVRFIKEAAKATGHKYANVNSLERKDIKVIMNEAVEKNKWSNQARNKYLSIFRALLSVLVDDLELMKFNPAKGIKDDPIEEGMGYKRLTDDEKKRIAEHLMEKAPDFFEYLMFIYDDGIRRKETLLLEIRDFNLTTREILIRPEVAKTNKARVVPITDTIMQILLRRQIWKYDSSHFLFSNDKFKPGPVAYHPNTPTKWWREMVIGDLNIDCKMYSLKHKGADDKILENIDLDALRNLYGHKSKQMTEGYTRAIKGRYKQQIIDKAPAFVKVIEMKKKVN